MYQEHLAQLFSTQGTWCRRNGKKEKWKISSLSLHTSRESTLQRHDRLASEKIDGRDKIPGNIRGARILDFGIPLFFPTFRFTVVFSNTGNLVRVVGFAGILQ
jgi:hypothetical protein